MERRTHETWLMITVFLIAVLISVVNIQPAKANGTIYIRADGTIDPPEAPIITYDNLTYTLIDNITSSADGIVVERDNIIIDGASYTLQGTGSNQYQGIDLSDRSNVTVKNTSIKNFSLGLHLTSSSNSSIFENDITNNGYGVWLVDSPNNILSRNNITVNTDEGIYLKNSSKCSINGNKIADNKGVSIKLKTSSNNTITANFIANNEYGIRLNYSSNNNISSNTFINNGLFVWFSFQNIVENNTVNGKPLVYLEGVSNYTVGEDAGQVILVRCNRIKVEDLNLSRTGVGIQLLETSNSSIIGNNITANNYYGIYLSVSSNNSISGNDMATNIGRDIMLYQSVDNNITGNSITGKTTASPTMFDFPYSGISLYLSDNNSISGNEFIDDGLLLIASYMNSVDNNTVNDKPLLYLEGVSNYAVGNAGQVVLIRCTNITVENFTLSSTSIGIQLWLTNKTIISRNDIANNTVGILSDASFNNSITGNDIANNTVGIWLNCSSGNKFYHNNFINNTLQLYNYAWEHPSSLPSINIWDNGYPSGGNYWSNYTGVDFYSGPYQNETGSDGIGDTPYAIDANNTDNYPFMNPPFHNVAFIYMAVPYLPTVNETVSIFVTIQNQGNVPEAFDVGVNYTFTVDHLIGTQTIMLKPGATITLTFTLTLTVRGFYKIKAYISTILDETNLEDNTRISYFFVCNGFPLRCDYCGCGGGNYSYM